MYDKESHLRRMQWFEHDRFGMFIHWGLYAIPARGEWVRSVEKLSVEDYQPYFDAFNPVDYDPVSWAKAAKEAGMQYAILTTKHHDGFCLFDSKLTDYKATNTKAGRDLVAEFVEAFRAEGLKVGLYYSIFDWHHPDYPHYGDMNHPMRDNEAFKDMPHDFDRYLEYMHGQVRELCCNYGKIDIMWFDFSYEDMSGEKWRATDLVRMIRSYQPDVILDNRLETRVDNRTSLMDEEPNEYAGDFVSPEQIIPMDGIQNDKGEDLSWEACITMNKHWGYCAKDKDFKPADMIIRKLVECVSKGGNLLVNVGPDARGNIPPECLDVLKTVGGWMKRNGESIYGCTKAGRDKPENGRLTRSVGNPRLYYYHITENAIGGFPLMGFSPDTIQQVRLLSDGSELPLITRWPESDFPDIAFVDLSDTVQLPDPLDTVVEIELK